MPWQEDASQKVMGSNLEDGKRLFSCENSVEVQLWEHLVLCYLLIITVRVVLSILEKNLLCTKMYFD